MKKLAAISGSSGFLGQHLIKALRLKDIGVLPIPRGVLYSQKHADDFFKQYKPDYIFALHAYGNMANQKDEQMIFNANLTATWNLLEATRDIDYKSFVYVSSSSVLLEHETIYSATKAGAERLCKAFFDEYEKPIVIIRPYSVYGEGEADFRFIPTVFRSCLTGESMSLVPDAVHDWVYVQYVIEIMTESVRLVDVNTDGNKHGLAGRIFNIGTGNLLSNRDIVDRIEVITHKKANIIQEKRMRSFDDNKWANQTHMFLNQIPLSVGLEKCYEFYKERYKR